MKLPSRTRSASAPPGLVATARVDRRTRALLPRLARGNIAVLHHQDMDRATAQALLDRGVAAVVNTAPFISGRYPNLGPQLLVEAGVALVEVEQEALSAIGDGRRIRLHDGGLHDGDRLVAQGHELDAALVRERMDLASEGLAAQLTSFTHNSAEFLRREDDLLLHGRGLPELSTQIATRPVVVVVPGHDHVAELAGIKRFISEQAPILVGVDRGADSLLEAGLVPDVVVVGADTSEAPSAKALRGARDVVVCVERGGPRVDLAHVERLVSRPLQVQTGATTEDTAMLIAEHSEASLIVGVGMHATLDEFLDRQRSGLASTYLTRLKVGPRLVDAAAVPTLYSGRVRPHHVWLVLLACLVALVAALFVTPVGQSWWAAAGDGASALWAHLTDLFEKLRGMI